MKRFPIYCSLFASVSCFAVTTITPIGGGPISIGTDGNSEGRAITFTDTNIYEDINFPISDLNVSGAANGPSIVDNSGRDGQSLAAVFVRATTSTTLVNPQMPHNWAAGTTIYPHFHQEPQTAAPETNTWEIKYSVADIGGTFPTWTIVTNTVIVPASQWGHRLVAIPTNGIPMTGITGPSTVVKLRYRVFNSGNVDPHMTSFDVHYRVGGSAVPFNP